MQTYTINNPISASVSKNAITFTRDPDITKRRILTYLGQGRGFRFTRLPSGRFGYKEVYRANEIASQFGYAVSHVRHYLRVLETEGLIESFKEGADTYWRKLIAAPIYHSLAAPLDPIARRAYFAKIGMG